MYSAERVRTTAIASLVLIAALGASLSHAEETRCVGMLAGVAVDNLRVPSGKTCSIDAVRVKGNVKVEAGAMLYARKVDIAGNVQAEHAKQVSVTDNSTVGGSIQIKQGGAATIHHVKVSGDIQFESNARMLSALNNRVGGNLHAARNRGGMRIAHNVIDGNLQCKENVPPPKGGGNTVRGGKEDQCERL
jgi:hypothetical protein